MKRFAAGLSAAAIVLGSMSAATLHAQDKTAIKDADRLEAAKNIIIETERIPEKAIPRSILGKAQCVVVIPNVIKGAFVFGGERGKGVATCRTGHGWSAPAFVQLTGVSFGFQIGGQATDLVLIAMNKGGLDSMLKSKVKLGADASAAAGPVGRDANANTDVVLNAQFLTYSRAKGLFAGIDLTGAVLAADNSDSNAEYGQDIPFEKILGGGVPVPADAQPFTRTVAKYFVASR